MSTIDFADMRAFLELRQEATKHAIDKARVTPSKAKAKMTLGRKQA